MEREEEKEGEDSLILGVSKQHGREREVDGHDVSCRSARHWWDAIRRRPSHNTHHS